jgi:type II secretory pathway pseudopilin PulG
VNDEGGYTITELLVAMTAAIVVLAAILTIVQVATRQQDRVAEQVAANQRARPTMTRIVDRLHSACVSPGLAPVQPGSDGDTLIVLSKAGADVSPVPDRYVLDFSAGVLTETVYPGTGGEPEEWTFGAPTERQLLDGVSNAALGEPAASVPVFRYFAYADGEVDSTPLPTALSAEDAARTVQVDIAFTVAPHAAAADPSRSLAVVDSATLRIEPASEDSAEVNLPCV